MSRFFSEEQWIQFAREINLGTAGLNSRKVSVPPMPSDPEDHEGWQRYWAAKGWPWRREPEISQERQEELARRRMIQVDIEQGIYPFGGMVLTRADIEWLLVTHDDGRGPVDWSDDQQRRRKGLDLKGARVEEKTDLRYLPLAKVCGALSLEEQFSLGKIGHLTEKIIVQALLNLQDVFLTGAHLEKADLTGAHLEEANLTGAHLEEAELRETHLEKADLKGAHLEKANLAFAHLEEADLKGAHLEEANLAFAYLEEADLRGASLSHAWLSDVFITNADGVGPALADVQWGETNLSVVGWSQVQKLRDEQCAHQSVTSDGEEKDQAFRSEDYQLAHRATHQLATVLQNQGLIDDASRFAYRAKCLQRTALWYDLLLVKTMKHRIQISWALLFSWALFLLAGYGYRLWRCLFWYIGIVLAFTLLYWWSDPVHLPWWAALGESVNVFHGRGASPIITTLAHPVRFTLLTVVEAVFGLVIEVIFVATMVQRLFGK